MSLSQENAAATAQPSDSAAVQAPTTAARRKSVRDRAKALKKEKKKERLRVKAIVEKQKNLEKEEISLDWRIVIGYSAPKKRKDTYVIPNVTRRNIWFEDNFIYNYIKGFEPEKFFHSPDKYALKWQPPGSLFKLIVPLDNPQTLENALLIMSELKPAEQKKVIFFFSPIDPGMSLYAPKVHPASLVSYRTKNEVLRKLTEFFLLDKIDVDEIQAIFTCDQRVWNASLYNLLPPDEQVFHTYLNEVPNIEDTSKKIGKSYVDGDITLQQYADLKNPERKKQKDVENMEYPLPFEKEACRICYRENVGIIKCHTCENMVCADCFHSVFVDPKSAEKTAFLMMHQKYCMKLGEMAEITVQATEEPGYLREFRSTSRIAALELLMPKREIALFEEEAEISEDDDEKEYRRQEREQRRKRALEEAERLRRQNPPALVELVEQLAGRRKRLDHLCKEIEDLNMKLAEPGHTDQFVARNERLKAERIQKVMKQVQQPVLENEQHAQELNIDGGEFIEEHMKNIRLMKKEINRLTFVRKDSTMAIAMEAAGGEGETAGAADDQSTVA